MMRFEARGRFTVSPEQLWPLVSDTHRMNRALGLPVLRFTPEPLATGGSRVIGEHPFGSVVLGFLKQIFRLKPGIVADERRLRLLPRWPIVRWVEHPFEFEAPRRYSVLREYVWAPLGLFPFISLKPGVDLLPLPDGGTEVIAWAEIEPRNAQGAFLTRLVLGQRSCDEVIAQCRNFERFLLGQAPHPFPDLIHTDEVEAPPAPAPPALVAETAEPGATVEVTDAWGRLMRAGVRREIAELLRRHLESAPDDEVLKMRPFELADRWSVDRREALVACLHATTAGLTEMSWDVLCPGCRIPKRSVGSIDEVRGEVHCDYCNINFDASLDQQVEVRFSVAESLRHIEERRFCSGGPMNTPHVLAQAELQPEEARTIEVGVEVGVVRLRSLQSRTTAIVDVQADARQAEAALTLGADAIAPPAHVVAPGTIQLRVINRSGVQATLVMEDPGWPDTAATASVVGTIQEFRDLFDARVLAPGLQLAIQRQAFLFTDLTGSTALYHELGQARAFRLVQDHFRILFDAVVANRGAVVKTVGDAVMGAFPTGADAVAAALQMQRGIRELDTGGVVDPSRLLKVGVHDGPCIAVTANGRLDYFGTTINTAARVEHECRGGQVVITAEVAQDPGVQALLAGQGLPAEVEEVRLRGLAAPVQLHRLTMPVRELAATT
jgi:class 3 adenylate cyclase